MPPPPFHRKKNNKKKQKKKKCTLRRGRFSVSVVFLLGERLERLTVNQQVMSSNSTWNKENFTSKFFSLGLHMLKTRRKKLVQIFSSNVIEIRMLKKTRNFALI